MTKIELPEGIFGRIMARIKTEQRILVFKRGLTVFSAGFIGSAIALIPALKMLYSSFFESGFMQLFSLIFSDFEIIIAYWQNFAISLLESLPVISLAIFLAVIFVFLESLRFLARDVKFIFESNKLIIS